MGRNSTFQQLGGRWRGLWIVVGLGIIVFLLLIAVLGLTHNKPQTPAKAAERPTASFKNAEQGISFSYYTDDLATRPLTSQDAADQIIGRLGGVSEPMLITVQYEKDLSKISGLLHREPLDIVVDNSSKVLPQKYPGFHQVKDRQFTQDGHKAAEIIFTYKGNNQQTIETRFGIFLRNNDEAIYLNAQSPQGSFAKLDRQVFDLSFSSLKFNN